MKKRMLIAIMVVGVLLLIIGLAGDRTPLYPSIFKDIGELEDALAPYIVGPAEDPAIGSLDYTQAVQCIVEKDGQKFTVFAYTFADVLSASRYRTGYKGNMALSGLRSTKTHTIILNSTTEYTAWYDTNVLYVKGATHGGTANFMNWLEGYLTLKETDIIPAYPG